MHRQLVHGITINGRNLPHHLYVLNLVAFELRSSPWAPSPELATEQLHQGLDPVLAAKVLCEHVRRIHFAAHLAKFDGPAAHLFLYPEGMSGYVSQLAQALARAYAHRCAAVRPDTYGQIKAEISKNTLLPQRQSTCFYNSIKLGLRKGQANRGLGGAPSLQYVSTKYEYAAARTFPSFGASTPVGVAVTLGSVRRLEGVLKH